VIEPLVVVGDALLDLDLTGEVERICPDAPVPVLDVVDARRRPGGAGLAAVLARRSTSRPVTLMTAIGDDAAGATLRELLADAGVDLVDLGSAVPTVQKVRVGSSGQRLLRLDLGHHPDELVDLRPGAEVLERGAAVLVSDYGRHPVMRDRLAGATASVPVVWDPHPRGPQPVRGCRLVTPNEAEAHALAAAPGTGVAAAVERAERLRSCWEAHSVAVTCGRRGAVLVGAGAPLAVPVTRGAVDASDACGAGDAFASLAALALADGHLVSDAVVAAVQGASDFVAGGGAGAIGWDAADGPSFRPAPPRAERPAVVATGGCFDLLHAGHIATLQAARGLGDRLVVLVNSDRSIARLKGPGRPLQPEADRVAILRSLGCVDEVRVFEEDTPLAALEVLRPALFVKGGDYSVETLPETPVLARWGGRTVTVPYLSGRSTSRIVSEASRHGT
jgi:rfaE bifunctional protein nucleotidyltransferase chain/domain/rfaE bifunctional protein kinase chain/domain